METSAPSMFPRASLLGIPTELRLLIYDYVFGPIEHRQRKALLPSELREDYYYSFYRPKPGLTMSIPTNGYEHWREIVFALIGSVGQTSPSIEQITALFSLPCVCKTMRRELRNVVAVLAPVNDICFVFNDFSKGDMERFINGMGEKSAKYIRKWKMHGKDTCSNSEYQDGHLLKGWHGTCTFFTDGNQDCNQRCGNVREDIKTARQRCERSLSVELDKFEEHEDCVRGVAPWESVWRLDNVRAEDRLEKLKLQFSSDRETAKKALLLYRHVVLSTCVHNGGAQKNENCFFSDPLDPMFNEKGELDVTKKTFVKMMEAVTSVE